jgi:hypothetical protein
MSLVINLLRDDRFVEIPAPATRYANAGRSGVFGHLANFDRVRNHPGIEEVPVFVQRGQRVAAPPDNGRYLAFVMASGSGCAELEQALVYAKLTP